MSDELETLRRSECLDCGHKLIPGPRGGASQNFYCDGCGHGFNLHGIDHGVMGWEPLGLVAPELIALYRDKSLGK